MCGIAGIFNSSLSDEALYVIGQEMIKQIHHRGPDGNGIVVRRRSEGGGVLLTHVRLSILDLSDAGSQPMVSEDGGLWIVFNGEIYNFAELRSELEKVGARFRSHSDTEVILAAYRHWGLSCFDKFIGMWALALWDEKEDSLILSRDRLGIKPLYFARHGDAWVFGSEPKLIVEQVPETRRLNQQAISDYFSYRYVLGGDSFFEGIHSVTAGTHRIIRGDTAKEVRYWQLPVVVEKQDPGEESVREALELLMDSAVRYRMIADVPVGSFLSGGLDSSVLVRLMSQQHREQIKTFTIGFPEKDFNEFEYAQEVAKHCSTDHKEIVLDAERYLDSMQTMLKIKDAPLSVPNEIALHELSKVLKQDITVVLSGEGADELFGGYGRIFRSAFDYQRVALQGVYGLSDELRSYLLDKYAGLEWSSEIEHFLGQYSYMDFDAKSGILTPALLSDLGKDPHNCRFFADLWQCLDGMDLHEKYMWIFQRVHLEGLLGRLDSATMSASVEGRVPFVDHRLIEYVSALPLHYKMRWIGDSERIQAKSMNSNKISEHLDVTKYLLRSQYQPQLPERIVSRKKVGFPVPLGQWMSGPMRDYARDLLLGTDAYSRDLFQGDKINYLLKQVRGAPQLGLQLWMLLNVEGWMREYNVKL